MKKVFLCHASEDKEYVRIVAKKLTRAKVIFDEMIFNVAEDFRDEIIRALDDTMIFVFIVSRKSIEKIWCKFEIDNAQLKLMEGKITKCMSIIIDHNVAYEDLPDWMRKSKIAIQTKPSQAIREIQQQLFALLPANFKKPYVGRLKELEDISQRIVSESTHVFSVYGLDGIGRRGFLERVCQDYLSLHLGPFFIIEPNYTIDELYPLLLEEVADIGTIREFSQNIQFFKKLNYSEKTDEVIRMLDLLCQERNFPCFIDRGGLLTDSGEFCDYIKTIYQHFVDNQDDYYCAFIHQRKVALPYYDHMKICVTALTPLQAKDSILLLRQLLNNASVEFTASQLKLLANATAGYPPASYFTLNYVKQYGIDLACESLAEIIDFNAKNFTPYLSQIAFSDNEKKILMYMASESAMPFDAISIALDIPTDILANDVKRLIDLCLVVQYDGVYLLSSPISNSVSRLWGFLDDLTYDGIAKRLSSEYWNNDQIAPPILVIDATIHASVMAEQDISSYGEFVSASTLLRFSTTFYRQKKWEEAFAYASKVLEIDASRVEAKRIKLKSLIQLEHWQEAEDILADLSGVKDFFYLEGFLLKKKKNYALACKSFEKALETGDNASPVYRDYADVLYRLRNYSDAEKNLNIVLQRDSGNIYVLDLLIRIYMQTNKFDVIEKMLDCLEKNDTDEKFIHHRRAAWGIMQKKFDMALQEATIACSKENRLFEAFGQKTNVLIEMEQYQNASQCLDEIAGKFGRSRLDIQLGLRCKLLAKQGKWREANIVWEKISEKENLINQSLKASILRLELNDKETSLFRKSQIRKQLETIQDFDDSMFLWAENDD